jgi:hypothetical protein
MVVIEPLGAVMIRLKAHEDIFQRHRKSKERKSAFVEGIEPTIIRLKGESPAH